MSTTTTVVCTIYDPTTDRYLFNFGSERLYGMKIPVCNWTANVKRAMTFGSEVEAVNAVEQLTKQIVDRKSYEQTIKNQRKNVFKILENCKIIKKTVCECEEQLDFDKIDYTQFKGAVWKDEWREYFSQNKIVYKGCFRMVNDTDEILPEVTVRFRTIRGKNDNISLWFAKNSHILKAHRFNIVHATAVLYDSSDLLLLKTVFGNDVKFWFNFKTKTSSKKLKMA